MSRAHGSPAPTGESAPGPAAAPDGEPDVDPDVEPAPDAASVGDDAAASWRLPRWAELPFVALTAVVVGVGGAGLLLAVLGRYGLASALLWGLGVAVVAGGPAVARLGRHRAGRPAQLPTLAMLVVAVVSAVVNAHWASAAVAVTGPDGVNAVAGRWLAAHGTLQVPAGGSWSALAGVTDPTSAATYTDAGGSQEFAGNHLVPVLFALAHGLGGDRALAAANAVIAALALFAVYAVGLRLCRRPWLVVAAVTTLGMGLPQLQASRETLSEPLVQLLLWSGLWLLLTAWERRSLPVAALGGLTLGATLAARIDTSVYLALLPLAAGLAWVGARERDHRRFLALGPLVAVLAAVPTALLAAVDLRQRGTAASVSFRAEVGHPLLLGVVATVVGVVLAVVLARVGPPPGWERVRSGLGGGLGVAVGVGLVLAWGLRPAVQQLHGTPNALVAALQAHEFVPSAPELTYQEYSLTWFSWYLGPVALALAVVGAALLTRAAVRGAAPALLLLVAVGPGAARYLYAVGATPAQLDVMQRFVPAVLPAFALAAAVGLDALAMVAGRAGRPAWGRTALALGAVALLAFPVARLGPVRSFREDTGYTAAVDRVCAALGPRSAVAFAPGDALGDELVQTVRSSCDVPATRLLPANGTGGVDATSAAVRAQGRTLWVLGASPAAVAAVAAGLEPQQLASVTNPGELESTLTRPPAEFVSQTLTVWGARVG